MARQDYIFYFPGPEAYERNADEMYIEPEVAKLHAKYVEVLPPLDLFQRVVSAVRSMPPYEALVIDVRNKKLAKFNARRKK